MLKQRIIPKFLLRDGRLVKYTRFFEQERQAGNPVSTARVYNDYDVDELIILDIAPSEESRHGVLKSIFDIGEEVFMPLTVGGGIRTIAHINDLLRIGADKVAINSQAVRAPEFVKEAGNVFGNQCITVSIDYKEVSPGVFRVFIDSGREITVHDPVEWAMRMQDLNCGEILLTSIDRDGTMSGYDMDMVARLNEILSVPLVVSGGCGSLKHCIDTFNVGVSAVAISSLFLFTDHSPIKLRSHLVSNGINVRPPAPHAWF
jgi:cyclase